MIKKTARLR